LPYWDYGETGAYYATICTHRRECLFGDTVIRSIVESVWRSVVGPRNRPDEFVVMPNHVHGIVWLDRPRSAGIEKLRRIGPLERSAVNRRAIAEAAVAQPLRRGLRDGLEPGSLFVIIRTFKSAVTKRINNLRGTPGAPVWQEDYYEHVIRDEEDLSRIRQYILDNPLKWAEDPDNPANFREHARRG
jgi:REP element-mobilizing transposase RayT